MMDAIERLTGSMDALSIAELCGSKRAKIAAVLRALADVIEAAGAPVSRRAVGLMVDMIDALKEGVT